MKKSGIILLGLTLFACQKEDKNQSKSAIAEEKSGIENLNISLEKFSEIDNSGIFMFPLKGDEIDKIGSNSSYYKETPIDFSWNIAFYNSHNQNYHLLTQDKILIANYNRYYDSENDQEYQELPYLFYEAISDDYNQDKILNEKDPTYLYISDKQGNNFRIVSPKNHHITQWEYLPTTDKVLLTARKDTNQDKLFDTKDEVFVFEIILNAEQKQTEIFSNNFKNHLKKLYDRDWKKVK